MLTPNGAVLKPNGKGAAPTPKGAVFTQKGVALMITPTGAVLTPTAHERHTLNVHGRSCRSSDMELMDSVRTVDTVMGLHRATTDLE